MRAAPREAAATLLKPRLRERRASKPLELGDGRFVSACTLSVRVCVVEAEATVEVGCVTTERVELFAFVPSVPVDVPTLPMPEKYCGPTPVMFGTIA